MKLRETGLCLCLAFVLLATAPVFADEFYRYVDKEGTVCFTDNPANIPNSGKIQANTFEVIEKNELQRPKGRQRNNSQPLEKEKTDSSMKTKTLSEQAGILEKEKQRLEQTIQKLAAQSLQLKKQFQGVLSAEENKLFRQKTEALNQKIEAYEKQRNLFTEKIHEYNKKVEKLTPSTTKEKPPDRE